MTVRVERNRERLRLMPATEPLLAEPDQQRRERSVLRVLHRSPLAALGVIVLLVVIVAAIFAAQFSPYDPVKQSLGGRLLGPLQTDTRGDFHLLGTDQLGRDILSRLLYGARISLLVAFVSVAISATIGLILGLSAGFFGGWLDSLVMAVVNLQLAFPFMLLALAIVALLGANLRNIIIVFVTTGWPIYARTIRAAVLALKESDFVEAARTIGSSDRRLMVRHILPNVVSPLSVLASFSVAQMIILEAALGFLGLSIQPPTPTWGNMLADGRQYIEDAWWLSAFPGLAIMITGGAVNFVGDGLRDLFDPTS